MCVCVCEIKLASSFPSLFRGGLLLRCSDTTVCVLVLLQMQVQTDMLARGTALPRRTPSHPPPPAHTRTHTHTKGVGNPTTHPLHPPRTAPPHSPSSSSSSSSSPRKGGGGGGEGRGLRPTGRAYTGRGGVQAAAKDKTRMQECWGAVGQTEVVG